MLVTSARESKDLAEKIEEAVSVHKALLRLYKKWVKLLGYDPPPEVRKELWYEARATLRRWIRKSYADEMVKKLIGKISNGFEYWFTFVIHPGVESTNKRHGNSRDSIVSR